MRLRYLIPVILLSIAIEGSTQVEWQGADLSFVPRLEYEGATYTICGLDADALCAFETGGWNVVRLRLWHSPAEPWHGLDSCAAFARRAKLAGFEILLDFHYSDSWADPGQQTKPAAWQSLDFNALVDSVYEYTNAVIRRFRDEDALPKWVQIGNEINPGMLWPEGRVDGSWNTPQQWNQLCTLLDAGADACRDSLPPEQQPKIMIHVALGGDNAASIAFFDQLAMWGLTYDIIAQSYYPWWHGSLEDLEINLDDLGPRYNKEIWVVETAYPFTLGWNDNTNNIVGLPEQLLPGYPATPAGQAEFIAEVNRIVAEVPGGYGKGVCCWEPAWMPTAGFGSPWENLALFDFSNNALPGLLQYGQSCAPKLRAIRDGDELVLSWPEVSICGTAAQAYRVYAMEQIGGSFHLLQVTTETELRITAPWETFERQFYWVELDE